MSKIEVHTDLRAEFSPVGNQGRRPTCLAFATTSAHEHLHKCVDALCAEWIYYHAVSHEGASIDSGSSLPATQHVLMHYGQPFEFYWPYASVDPSAWSPPKTAPTTLFHAKTLNVTSAYQDLSKALNAGQPSIIALNIGGAFQRWSHTSGEAVIADETEDLSQGAGHALLAVGHGEYEKTQLVLIRNSWGRGWGDDGYAWISANHMKDRWIGGFRLEEI